MHTNLNFDMNDIQSLKAIKEAVRQNILNERRNDPRIEAIKIPASHLSALCKFIEEGDIEWEKIHKKIIEISGCFENCRGSENVLHTYLAVMKQKGNFSHKKSIQLFFE